MATKKSVTTTKEEIKPSLAVDPRIDQLRMKLSSQIRLDFARSDAQKVERAIKEILAVWDAK